MASILRTGKLLRYFAGFTRNVVVNSVRDADNGNLVQTTTCMCSQYQHGFANRAAPKPELNLEKQLRRLDQDVRRIGRISRRDIEEVLEEIRAQRSATSSQSLLVIRCCGNLVPEELPEVRTALVQEIWKTFNALNIPMDISHYNALLRVYLENEHPFSPVDILSELESKAIEANRVTYQRLIARYCQQGNIDGATNILEFMRQKNLPVNENVFNSLIIGHAKANDMESAKGILSVMKQAGLEPSADTYSTLLSSYALYGDIDSILQTLSECEKNEIILLDRDLLETIYQLAINNHGDKIDPILQKFRLSIGFNQDAANVILRLVNKGYEDVGYKILRLMPRPIRPDGHPIDVGTFFIKQMVKVNRPIEKILSICKSLQEEGLNPKALLIATEAGLNSGLVKNTFPLLNEMKNAGLPIRQHYFWPLICAVDSSEVINIVRRMQEEFSLNPNTETIRDYVIPNLKEKNWDRVLGILRDVGVSNATAAASAAYSAIISDQLKSAATIMESYRAYYAPLLFRQPLILGLSHTDDYESFVRIVRQLYESVQNRQNNTNDQKTEQNELENLTNETLETNEANVNDHTPDIVGSILMEVCNYFRRNRTDYLENILPALVEQGLPISNASATRISDRLGADMTPELSEMLGKLSSGELELVPLNTEKRKRSLDSLTIEELERFIANVEAKGENANNIKRQLINACFRSKNLEKTLQVIEKLEAEKFNIYSGIWSQLIDLYVHHSKLSEALELYEKMKSKEPDFLLDNLKTIRLVNLLLNENRFDEALQFLEKNKKPEIHTDGENSFNYAMSIWRILNAIAETGEIEKLQRLFNAFVEGNYVLPNNIVLGPLIKVHLVKDDLSKAIEVFEHICEKYKVTPWKNELACRLIQKEDATNLQKLTDLSTDIHGEVNSLYDLVFSFVECGRIRQARKILETPGLRSRPHRIENACERYKNEGLVEPLEGLIEATKDLNHIDRNNIYYNLLLSYCKTEDTEKAIGLWTKMQEENITPTDLFLIKLADLLKKKNVPVPFVVPERETRIKTTPVNDAVTKGARTIERQTTTVNTNSSPVALFRKAIRNGDIDAAFAYKEQLQNEKLSVTDLSHMVEMLVRAQRLTEATKYVFELLDGKRHPVTKIFKFYLNKIAASGDIDTMERISEKISNEEKRLVSFDNRFCNACIAAGKSDQYFKRLSDEIHAAKSAEEAAKLAEKFPRGGALGLLQKKPELEAEFKKLAEKYAEFNLIGPMNVLWIYYTSQGNESASRAVWDQYLSNTPRLMFQRVLQTAREQKDGKIVESVINQLRSSKISEGAIGNAYSCLVDIHVSNGNMDKALDTLKTAIKDVCLENINRTALQRLKAALEEQNKEFPYTIPEKRSKDDSSSSSSSSSDEDVKTIHPETVVPKPSKRSE